ncbi:beta-lactamase [Legionella birminghamensis]|uniref:Beta-lactamase n=1 Tax=Legionella birminghamensis TaxID=28083 RepID=A0A378I9A5_9GAMM|nr:serine hydrolase domain-containing protein [Legionella birminghamensis]KTC67971.1 beta-lactamase [Legionella birminghamensis]STX31320.1 beta-lactamase [Legionella birminghamensis]
MKFLRLFVFIFVISEKALAISVEAKIDPIVQAAMQNNHIPGLALAVLKDGQPLLIKGYGNAQLNPSQPVTTNRLFAIGSISKVYTAFAIMKLVQEGKIELDDSILKYLPNAPSAWRAVTIRELLSHTSGIPQHQGPHLPWLKVWQQLAKRPMQFTPGTQTRYNNFGFIVLGRVIERVSGQSLAVYLQDTIFNPLSLSHTGFPASLNPPGLAAGYHFVNGQFVPAPNRKPWQQMWGSGGIVSTIDDMAKWDMAMTAGQILSSKTYAQMWGPVSLKNGQPSGRNGLFWSLGWQVSFRNSKLVAQKDGAIRGYSSFIIRHIDDKISIIILTNTNKVRLPRLARDIFEAVKNN